MKELTLTTLIQHSIENLPWLVWLGGLSAGLCTKASPVQFPVRTHAWARSPVGGMREATTQ